METGRPLLAYIAVPFIPIAERDPRPGLTFFGQTCTMPTRCARGATERNVCLRIEFEFDMRMRGTLLLLVAVAAFGCAPGEADVRNGAMVLDICGARKIKNPTDEQIRIELGNLSTKNEDSFAILGPSEMTYIQAGGDKSVGFHLEYQDGSVDAHFQATNEKITLDEVVSAFIAFRDGHADWQKAFAFRKIKW